MDFCLLRVFRQNVLSCSFGSSFCNSMRWKSNRFLWPWGFSRQEYWNRLPCLPPGDLPNPGVEPRSPTFQVDYLTAEPPGKPQNTKESSLYLLHGILPTQEYILDFIKLFFRIYGDDLTVFHFYFCSELNCSDRFSNV